MADRDYMRDSSHEPWRVSWTVALIVINVAVFIAENIVGQMWREFPLSSLFALSIEGLKHGFVWQLITFQFLHANLLHIVFNMIALYVFGRAVEQALGVGRFLTLYLSSGVAGGLIHVLGSWLFPRFFGGVFPDGTHIPVVGASAGLYGVIAAFAMMFPYQRLTLFLFYVLPVNLSARTLLVASVVLGLVGLFFDKSHVAHAAHLGGLLAGILFIKFYAANRVSRQFSEQDDAATFKPARRTSRRDTSEAASDALASGEVDAILDKISAHGIQSLTERERKVLESAQKALGKR